MEQLQYRPPCPPENRSLAMVYGVDQQLRRTYEPAQAIRNGTLYPELYKPMLGKTMPIDGAPVTARQTLEFCAWELRLYLDTHPDDQQALRLYRRFCAALKGTGYPCAFVSEGDGDETDCPRRWSWVDDPWPWEYQNCGRTEGDGHVCV